MKTCKGCLFENKGVSARCMECLPNKDLPLYVSASDVQARHCRPAALVEHWWEGNIPQQAAPEGGGGLRYNEGKRRYDLIPPDALAALADLYTRGAQKYAERNWEKGMKYSNVLASLERHMQDWKAGIDRDEETTALHMIHVAWNAITLAVYQLRGIGLDDRVKVKMPDALPSAS